MTSSAEDKFDAIIVGAGPAGSSCAYSLAKAGLKILLVERGKFPGAKNMWGGVLFASILNDLIPDFREEAPLERHVRRHSLSILSGKSSICVDLSPERYTRPPYDDYIILRARFDQWLAQKAEQAGAILATGLAVTDVCWNGDQITGVVAGGDEIPADVVIECDGAYAGLSKKANIRGQHSPRDVKQGVKEVIKLPRDTIEKRFNLQGDEGAMLEFLGEATNSIPGGGFIYTNKESVSIGVVVQLESLLKNEKKASDILDDFKSHPAVAQYIDGGEIVEYSAHLIPVFSPDTRPPLYTNGLLVAGDAAALVLGTGLILEGANFAIASGIAAAETVKEAKSIGDFSKTTLSKYQELLESSFVLSDLKTFKRSSKFLENPRIYETYPGLLCSLVDRLYARDSKPRKSLWQIAREEMKGRVSLWQLLVDLLKAKRAL